MGCRRQRRRRRQKNPPSLASVSASVSVSEPLEHALASAQPFALLLLEIDGADRLPVTEGVEAAGEVLARGANAVRAVLGQEDSVVDETPGRMLLLLPGSGRPAALTLAERIAAAVERASAVRGAPLTASVGVALHPLDGDEPGALIGQAEQSLYAARAAGVRVGRTEPEARSGPRLVR